MKSAEENTAQKSPAQSQEGSHHPPLLLSFFPRDKPTPPVGGPGWDRWRVLQAESPGNLIGTLAVVLGRSALQSGVLSD